MTKEWALTVFIVTILLFLSAAGYMGFSLGRVKLCTDNQGTLTAEGKCVNIAKLPYCQLNGTMFEDKRPKFALNFTPEVKS